MAENTRARQQQDGLQRQVDGLVANYPEIRGRMDHMDERLQQLTELVTTLVTNLIWFSMRKQFYLM